MLTAVILSGGESRRMGSPKALLRFQGKSFLEYLLELTTHPRIGARRIVLGPDADAIQRVVPLPPAEVVVNADWKMGKLSSIHAALRALPEPTDGILLCLIDHPRLSSSLVDSLIHAFYATGKPIVLPLCDGRRGHPVIFAASLYQELFDAPMNVGARAVVWAHAREVAEVPTEDRACLLNINDAKALASLEQMT